MRKLSKEKISTLKGVLYDLSIRQVSIIQHSFICTANTSFLFSINYLLNTYYALYCPWNLRLITEQDRQKPVPSWNLYDWRERE